LKFVIERKREREREREREMIERQAACSQIPGTKNRQREEERKT
jgi:hypothetical protein